MKTYQVHFTYYSENYGQFDESVYKVDAENPFEARQMAWSLRDTDDEARFQSCVRLCGVTWNASPLDMADYFNASAAYDKYMIRRYLNVEAANAAIKKDSAAAKRAEYDRALYVGSLDAVSLIARDIGKPLGMEPPAVYEEIEYAWRLVGKFDETGLHDKADALARRIDKAKKWDAGAILALRSLFEHEEIHLPGDYVNIGQYFTRNGVYPVYTEKADINEREYHYITRWTNTLNPVESLKRLPMFGEEDIIRGSESLPFDYRTLVLRHDALTLEYRKPENILWTPHCGNDGICPSLENASPDTRFNAENMITGMVAALRKKDFLGVLRPERADNINFDALKQEYAIRHTKANENGGGVFRNTEEPDVEGWETRDKYITPNHVTNKLTATGAPDKVKSFFAAVNGGMDETGNPRYMDFEKIKPMPETLRVECSNRSSEALKLFMIYLNETKSIPEISALLGEKNTDATKRLLENLKSEDIKPNLNDSELLAFGEQLFNNIREHGAPTWYEWSIQNWGTKWNAYSQTRIDGSTIQFNTAWSDVHNLMQELSRQHPDVTLSYKFAEEQWGLNTGILSIRRGNVYLNKNRPTARMTQTLLRRNCSAANPYMRTGMSTKPSLTGMRIGRTSFNRSCLLPFFEISTHLFTEPAPFRLARGVFYTPKN